MNSGFMHATALLYIASIFSEEKYLLLSVQRLNNDNGYTLICKGKGNWLLDLYDIQFEFPDFYYFIP